MKNKYYILLLAVALFVTAPAKANPDTLLNSIKADLKANRLTAPANNNALQHIQEFRRQAPFDYRVLPLVYEWGRAQVNLAQQALVAKDYNKAQAYLNQTWPVAALTPGLEALQQRLDQAYKAPIVRNQGPTAAELAAQKKLAQAAAAEKAQAEAARKRQLQLEQQRTAQAQQLAEQQRLQRVQQEALRRQNAEAEALRQREEARKQLAALWQQATETSPVLSSFELSAEAIRQRQLSLTEALAPVCQAIVDNDASVVVHAANKADYRWLTVRLTLCLRHVDDTFRLRHSFQPSSDGTAEIALHESRDASLLRQAADNW